MPALFEEGEPVHRRSGILPYKESKRWTHEAAQNSDQHQQKPRWQKYHHPSPLSRTFRGSKDPNNRALGPKYHSEYGISALGPSTPLFESLDP